MSREKSENKQGRRDRVPFGGHRRRLHVSYKQDGYVYRWFNDVQDRIQRALDAGYEFVQKKEAGQVGDPDAGNRPDGLDSRVSKRVNENLTCYLMKIKEEYWSEDQEIKQKEADAIDEAIFGGGADKVPNSYGLKIKYGRGPQYL